VLLFRLELDDTFVIHHEGTRYVYKVTNKQVIEPSDFSLIQPTKKPTVTLITCTPPGTSWKRLVIQAEQISPDPSEATKASSSETIEADIVPSNAPSFWSELWDSIF
jgi:LPXTG-site transpeptidase (sortase) family protein